MGINDYGRRLLPDVAAAPCFPDNDAGQERRQLRRRAADVARRAYFRRAAPRFYRILCKTNRQWGNFPYIMIYASILGHKYEIRHNSNRGHIKVSV